MKKNRRNHQKNKNPNYSDTKKITNILLKAIFILAILFLIIVIFNVAKNWIKYNSITKQYLSNLNTLETPDKEEKVNSQENSDTSFNLTAVGDIMCHNTQYIDAYNSNTGKYDFSYVFDDINHYIKNSDITIANLETTFAGEDKGYSNYPRFNTPDALAYNLKKLGVDVISTAGNHSLDYGFDGLSRTIDILNSADISHVGTYKTQEERDTIVFKYVKGIKIAFINYAYGTNGITIPSDKAFCINLIDKDLIKKDIENAKSQNADMIVASVHWGTEYSTIPNDTQNELADFLFQNGVNIILGTHPHVLQKMEKRTVTLEDGTTQDGFIIYSLGNFISDQNAKNTRTSIILDLKITKHADNSISIDEVNYTPIYMYKNSSASSKKMKLLDINKTISLYENGTDTSIGENMYTTLKKELDTISANVNGDGERGQWGRRRMTQFFKIVSFFSVPIDLFLRPH